VFLASLLDKLLLYEGVFFLPHQRLVNGVFGTLVVSLPSKYEGGDMVASHKENPTLASVIYYMVTRPTKRSQSPREPLVLTYI
jgi:hypothetical protein